MSTDSLDPVASKTGAPNRLSGNLGVVQLVLTVLAYNAPVTVAAAFVPLVIGFGNHDGATLSYLAIGVLLVVFSVGLTTMARCMKSPGAFYTYISTGIGPTAGLAGAFAAIAGYVVIAALCAINTGLFAKVLVEHTLHGPAMPWWVWATVAWIGVTLLSLLHIDLSAKVLGIAMMAEIVLIGVWIVAVLIQGGDAGLPAHPFTFEAFSSGSVPFGLLFAVLSVTGFEAVAVFREEARNPNRTVPRATYAAVVFLCGLYAVVAYVFIAGLGLDDVIAGASTDPVGTFIATMERYVGSAAVTVVSFLLVSSSIAAQLATQNIVARYIYVLGRDRVLPARFAVVHAKHGSPYRAAALCAGIVFVFFAGPALAGADPVKSVAVLGGLGAVWLLSLMTVTSVAVIRFFRREPQHAANIWQRLIAPVLSFLGLAGVLVLAVGNADAIVGGSELQGAMAMLAVAAVMVAGAVYARRLKARLPDAYAAIGRQGL